MVLLAEGKCVEWESDVKVSTNMVLPAEGKNIGWESDV